MKQYSPVDEGVRIYNLFPLLAGTMDRWPEHMDRARHMGFNWIFINPFHLPGLSGSLYSIKDYYEIHPLFISPYLQKPPMDQLKDVVEAAASRNLGLIMDLVINHTAVDSPLIQQHPEWFLWGDDEKVINPSVWEGDRCVAVWGDLAEVDNANSSDRENLWKYWEDLTLFYREMGFQGFRCDAAYQVTDQLWKRLIQKVKSSFPDTLFFAESLGCGIEDVIKLARSGFDYTFNSSKYWDYEEAWCLSQYRESAPWAPSVSFAESHDTTRLFEELKGDINRLKQRYLFSALFATGVMMPIGFEFGFRKKLHVVKTRPADWEATEIDVTAFIRETNEIKKENPVFNQDGPIDVVDVGNSRILCLKKTTRQGDQSALILLNKDRKKGQTFKIPSFASIFPKPSMVRDLTPESSKPVSAGGIKDELLPSGYRVLAQQSAR